MKQYYKGIKVLCIADIHWGALPAKKLFHELKETFIKELKNKKESIDMIVFLGDYFDRKIPLTESHSIMAIKFLNSVCRFCKKYNIAIRVIKGTKTHDFNQLDNFKYLESQYSNFKIINTVTEEKFNDTNILYIPEEYMNDQDKFYEEFLQENKIYDFIFGHGTWDVFAFENQKQESERNIKGSPVLKYNEWESHVTQNIIFGHIHTHNRHKKLYYVGSYSRWIYGEEKPKGFIYINSQENSINIEFIENKLADQYNTVSIKEISNNNDIKDIIKDIEKLQENKNKNYKIRINKEQLSLNDLNILKEAVGVDSNIKIEYRMNIKDEIQPTEEYSFLGNDIDENIQNYIKEKNKKTIPLETIRELCTSKN